mmetsp:Transcript_22862/g.53348  ORF Transcript_22862/g.53348 Transcript_22862/m.53348 type:complete len:207 (-) Transcript_22862:2131-2751(-)
MTHRLLSGMINRLSDSRVGPSLLRGDDTQTFQLGAYGRQARPLELVCSAGNDNDCDSCFRAAPEPGQEEARQSVRTRSNCWSTNGAPTAACCLVQGQGPGVAVQLQGLVLGLAVHLRVQAQSLLRRAGRVGVGEGVGERALRAGAARRDAVHVGRVVAPRFDTAQGCAGGGRPVGRGTAVETAGRCREGSQVSVLVHRSFASGGCD